MSLPLETSIDEFGLTERQWERIAFGTAVEILNQALDNGDHTAIDNDEYMPTGIEMEYVQVNSFHEALHKRLDKLVSDLAEEAAKRD
jgi:hypothetical protein